VHLTVKDDGRGMVPEKLRESAVKKGLINQENATLLSDQEALELIFLPGFSSAALITDISGRGVGMDVVRTNIVELGGQVGIESTPNVGTTITLILPLTIVTTRILLIKVGSYTFALPASGCHGIIWVYENRIRTIEGRATINHESQTIPLLRMADLMNIESEPPFLDNKREPAVLIGSAQRLLSLLVDQLLDEREAVVKPLGPIFENQRRYNGAVQLGDGQLVLLLNPVSLVQSARGIAQTTRSTGGTTSTQQRPHLLVVEDSFTTRELIRSILQSAGYDVSAAIDGLDALDKLRVQSYDLVVTDVEMPRVDGFELTTRIRQELEELDMPVVIITSLASDEYRRRGLEAGAQAYIVKSQFNQDNLLNVINQLLGHEASGG
jgi:two-component system chemotaxis sensor kinase CheA